ncbi:MAG TPA: universal stress protein [Polyangiales bacterium]|nr:universal stress protein [Polyangiales bacterium]
MNPIKKMLCPTDFSDSSEAALALAVDLAAKLGSTLELVHVVQPPVYVGWEDSPAGLTATAQLLEQTRQRAEQQLQAAVAKLAGRGVEIHTHLYDGSPAQQIAELSKQVDLIVLGTHGRTGLPHLLLGSVAERVVRTASCPVLTVPRHKPE